jgi:N-acetylglutamate synthase-like GNAT family acetyltransferase
MKTRKARAADVHSIQELIAHYASHGTLLPRSEEDVRRHLKSFLVAVEDGDVIGCVSLESYSAALAEIRSLAVSANLRGRGIGSLLMNAALDLAEKRKIGKVFALTSAPNFFLRQGFELSSRFVLKEKIDRDCNYCPKAPTCRLSAVVMNVSAAHAALPVLPATSSLVQAD